MVRVDPFNCASPAVPSPLTYWNIDLGQIYSLRGVVMRAMAVPGNGAPASCRSDASHSYRGCGAHRTATHAPSTAWMHNSK